MSDSKSNAHEFTVSELSQSVKNAIEDQYGYVRVRGEVGRLSKPASGHVYFDLKDDRSVLAAVAWKGTVSRWKFKPEQGLEVIASGKLTTFAGQSKYQIIVENVEPAGLGALMALLEERRKKLEAEGVFAAEHKQAMPFMPLTIGVVTSPSGAVIRDIIHRIEDRFPIHVLVWPVRVQGEQCAPEVANAIEGFNMLPPDGTIKRPDIIIVARGGGSVEDLWGFNEEIVVRAISESEIPTISAIGHETDTTLTDFAADLRAPTPTGAAELAVPVRAELEAGLDSLGMRLRSSMRNQMARSKDGLAKNAARLPKAARLLNDPRQRLDVASTRLASALRHLSQNKRIALAQVLPRLQPDLLTNRVKQSRTFLVQSQRLQTNALKSLAERLNLHLQSSERAQMLGLKRVSREAAAKLEPTAQRLYPSFKRSLAAKAQELVQTQKLLTSYSYHNVLERGFAVLTSADGSVVKDSNNVAAGDQLRAQLATGELNLEVLGEQDQTRQKAKKTAKPKQSTAPQDNKQSSLF